MKRIRSIVLFIATASLLLAIALPVYAIGFDAETVYESVFVVHTNNSVGSGFAIGTNCVVTNAHVVENSSSIYLSSYSGEQMSVEVYLVDTDLDTAILVSPDTEFVPLPIANIDECKIGDDIYTIGAPNSMAYTLTKGVISAKERVIRRQNYIQIDAAINAGNSGGPLLNDMGEVLGINTLKMSDSEGIGLSIPINIVCEYLKDSGIELNADNHIEGKLTISPVSEEEVSNSESNENNSDQENKTNVVLVIALCASVFLNVVLFVILFYNKSKSDQVPVDPSERTDFEIEIEE